MPEHPTLLRRPNADPLITRAEDILPGRPEGYFIKQLDNVWRVIEVATGEVVYRGPGPVEVVRSSAPF